MAGAVWAGRKHIGKIIAVIAILLLLPVLFLLMLPGLIFGGLVNAFSPADPDTPILNSETAIVENANDITFAINAILGEALDDVMARIEVDFASSGADKMEVKNPYSSGLVYNANLIVSQYCAARDEDFESISLDDLSTVLRENKEHLYSYTSVRESREVTSEDPETGEETISTEIWMIYTIRYNGESYLADHVFALTDEQKELASDYASKLVFFADGELYEIAYIAAGQEALVCHALRGNKGGSRRIMLVDTPAQIAQIDCPGISGFCTVDEEGQTNYFKKAGGT